MLAGALDPRKGPDSTLKLVLEPGKSYFVTVHFGGLNMLNFKATFKQVDASGAKKSVAEMFKPVPTRKETGSEPPNFWPVPNFPVLD